MSFICGRAGVYAVGAVVAKHTGDEMLLDRYLSQFKEVVDSTACFMCLIHCSS